jgi:hypothetical protein
VPPRGRFVSALRISASPWSAPNDDRSRSRIERTYQAGNRIRGEGWHRVADAVSSPPCEGGSGAAGATIVESMKDTGMELSGRLALRPKEAAEALESVCAGRATARLKPWGAGWRKERVRPGVGRRQMNWRDEAPQRPRELAGDEDDAA